MVDPRMLRQGIRVVPENHSSPPEKRSIISNWSIEATLPKPEEVRVLGQLAGPDKEVFLSTLPHVSLDRQIETARIVRAAGLDPVPHIAVRYFSGRSDLSAYLGRIVGEGNVSRCLVIAGDIEKPRGEFDSAAQLIESGLLSEHGIRRVGIAGYPEGHPKIPSGSLDQALADKLDAARRVGIEVEVVTQFCFSAEPIVSWLAGFHERWPDVPVRIGLAGPTTVKALLGYAMRCGVKAPRGGLAHKLSMAKNLVQTVAPDGIIRDIDASPTRNSVDPKLSAHFFSFGGLERTARWAIDAYEKEAHPPN
jgi:methylenetetrahydrofolate reductase (NADPH)